MPILFNGMGRDESPVRLLLTMEEAEELLSRCLNSEERDTPVFQQALLKLARASFQGRKGDLLLSDHGSSELEEAA